MPLRARSVVLALLGLALVSSSVQVRAQQPEPGVDASQAASDALAAVNPTAGEKIVYWQVGLTVVPKTWPVRGGLVRIPIPGEWPEQKVLFYSEEPGTGLTYEMKKLDGGLDYLEINLPAIAKGDKAELSITYQITLRPKPIPDQVRYFVKPEKPNRELTPFLGSSPLIDPKHRSIKQLVEQETKDAANDWERVEKLYDWVFNNVELSADKPEGSVKTLANRKGCREDRINLFVAMCRCFKIPARTVWANGVEYAEFYLDDPQGIGYWIPCHFGGAREFGSLTQLAVIEQKGEAYKLPGDDERRRFVNATASVSTERNARGQPDRPSITFVRRVVPRPAEPAGPNEKK